MCKYLAVLCATSVPTSLNTRMSLIKEAMSCSSPVIASIPGSMRLRKESRSLSVEDTYNSTDTVGKSKPLKKITSKVNWNSRFEKKHATRSVKKSGGRGRKEGRRGGAVSYSRTDVQVLTVPKNGLGPKMIFVRDEYLQATKISLYINLPKTIYLSRLFICALSSLRTCINSILKKSTRFNHLVCTLTQRIRTYFELVRVFFFRKMY